jgi:membrane protein required for colicin V production
MGSLRRSSRPTDRSSMTPVDYVIVLLCVVSAGIGVWRGFVKEALSLATLLVAIWLAWRFAGLVEPALGNWGGAPEVRTWAARVVVFVLVLVAGALIAWFARTLVRQSGLTGVDRLLGAGFGLLRGVLIVGLAVIILQFLELDQDGWWQDARLRPYAEQVAAAVRYYAELGNRYLHDEVAV